MFYIRFLCFAFFSVFLSAPIIGQDDEARAASGLPQMIGRRSCASPVPGADASVSGTVVVNGMPEDEKGPTLGVTIFANGVVVQKERLVNRGSFNFPCVPRYGVTLVVEADGLEIGSFPLGSLNGPPLSNRQDVILTWTQLSRAIKQKNEVISVRNSHTRTGENQQTFDKAVASLRDPKLENSVKLFEQVVKDDKTDFVAWTELGNLYFKSESFAKAESSYGKALELKADFEPAMLNLGKLHVAQKKAEPAIELLTKVVNADPMSADGNHYLGEAYLLARKGSLAVGYLNKAIELAPVEKAEIHLRLAALYHGANTKDRAVREYQMFLEKVPEHPEKAKLQKYIADNSVKS